MSPVQQIASLIVCMQRDCRHQHELWEPLSRGYADTPAAQCCLGTSDSSTGTRKSRPIAEGLGVQQTTSHRLLWKCSVIAHPALLPSDKSERLNEQERCRWIVTAFEYFKRLGPCLWHS